MMVEMVPRFDHGHSVEGELQRKQSERFLVMMCNYRVRGLTVGTATSDEKSKRSWMGETCGLRLR